MPFADALATLGARALDGFWLPLAGWTFLAAPLALITLRLRLAPATRALGLHLLLLSLPLTLVVAWMEGMLPGAPPLVLPAVLAAGGGAAATTGPGAPLSLPVLAGVTTLAALLCAAVSLLRLGGRYRAARQMARQAARPAPSLLREVRMQAQSLGIRRLVRVGILADGAMPCTLGRRRPVLLLPADLLADAPALSLVVLHELLHVRRRDWTHRLVEEGIVALAGFHPLVTWIARQAAFERELACDAALLGRQPRLRGAYAELLLRFALRPAEPAVALGLAAPSASLFRRLQALQTSEPLNRMKTIVLSALLLLLPSLSGVVLAQDPEPLGDVFIVTEVMPRLLPSQEEGLSALAARLRYPEVARNLRAEGKVFVSFIVDKTGRVREAGVAKFTPVGSAPSAEAVAALEQEAVRVVETLRFEPGRQRGGAVAVRLVLPITFAL